MYFYYFHLQRQDFFESNHNLSNNVFTQQLIYNHKTFRGKIIKLPSSRSVDIKRYSTCIESHSFSIIIKTRRFLKKNINKKTFIKSQRLEQNEKRSLFAPYRKKNLWIVTRMFINQFSFSFQFS